MTEQEAKDYTAKRLAELRRENHPIDQIVNTILAELRGMNFAVFVDKITAPFIIKGVSLDAQGVIYHV
mgnify:CR=1 FL=1